MKTKSVKTVISGALLAVAGSAIASEPMTLNEAQLDNVTAGGSAAMLALASASGLLLAATSTATFAQVISFAQIPSQAGALTPTMSIGAATATSTSQ